MECTIIIKHWDEDNAPRKEIRLYDMRGQALGFGIVKIADTKVEKSDEMDLFADLKSEERCITYQVSLDLKQLGKYLDDDNHREEK